MLNIGHGAPELLEDFVIAIEEALNRKAQRNYMDMQTGDVPATWAPRLSDLRAAALPGGHFFPDLHPAETARALKDFLATAA